MTTDTMSELVSFFSSRWSELKAKEKQLKNVLLTNSSFALIGVKVCQVAQAVGEARVFVDRFGEYFGVGLEERLAAGERHAREKRIFRDFLEDFLCVDDVSALHRLRLGILAAAAAMRATLREDRQPHAITVDDALIEDARNPQVHACAAIRPCFTRSCSSARFASFQRSIVPTR